MLISGLQGLVKCRQSCKISCSSSVSLPELNFQVYLSLQTIFVDLKPDPIKILNIFTVARSPSQLDKGPWFYMDARKTPIYYEVTFPSPHLLCLVMRLLV